MSQTRENRTPGARDNFTGDLLVLQLFGLADLFMFFCSSCSELKSTPTSMCPGLPDEREGACTAGDTLNRQVFRATGEAAGEMEGV